MHFCGVLEAMRQQNQLQFSFDKSIPKDLPHTLANLVANTPTVFFALLKTYLTNFGLQYFLSHYLMSYEGREPVVALLNAVANAYDIDLVGSMLSYEVYVCGNDSRNGHQFLASLNAQIFGYDDKTIQQAFEDVKHVDLCIVINRADPLPRLAILGEVEGKHGAQMLKSPYWSGTASFCAFGVGVVLNDRKQMELQTFHTPTGPKSVLTLSSSHYVVADFAQAIGVLEILFFMSHQQTIPLFPGMDVVVNLIRDHWNKPVDDLIALLRSLIIKYDSNSVQDDLIALPDIPKIIV
jgi:hypothetical protein